jgi:hypothetical protein
MFSEDTRLSGKNIPSKIAVMIDNALETIIDQWYQSVSEYYITTEKKTENPDIFGPEELKRFHDESGHRIKFSKAGLDFTYGLSFIDDAAGGYALDVSVNNKVPNFNYPELSRRLTVYYQTNREKPVEGFTKLKKIRNCDAFHLKEDVGTIKVEEREGKADIVRLTFCISGDYLEDLVAEPGSFMELIQQYCVAPLRRIYAEVYRIKRK